jgi:hypothetical protein
MIMGIRHIGPQPMERAKDVGMAAQESDYQDSEKEDGKPLDHQEGRHW